MKTEDEMEAVGSRSKIVVKNDNNNNVDTLSDQVKETHVQVMLSLQESFNKFITLFGVSLERWKDDWFNSERKTMNDLLWMIFQLREKFEKEMKRRTKIHELEEKNRP